MAALLSEAVRPAFGAGGVLSDAGGGPSGVDAAQKAGVLPASWAQLSGDIRPRPLFSPEQTPEAIAKAAREKAQAEAQREAEVKAAARRLEEAQAHAGFLAGRDSGEKAAAAQYQARLGEVGESLARLAKLRADVLAQSEASVVRLALHIAAEVLLCDVEHRRSFTERMVEESLKLLAEADTITLRLAPADLEAIKARRPELAGMANLTLTEDPSIALGGVVADCALGRVDATLDARLAAMRQRLCPPPADPSPA